MSKSSTFPSSFHRQITTLAQIAQRRIHRNNVGDKISNILQNLMFSQLDFFLSSTYRQPKYIIFYWKKSIYTEGVEISKIFRRKTQISRVLANTSFSVGRYTSFVWPLQQFEEASRLKNKCIFKAKQGHFERTCH